MSIISELIKVEDNGLLSFGNYSAATKQKIADFEVKGDIYKLKTFKEITRLEKNENLLFEAVPGATVHNFSLTEKEIKFSLEGIEDTQITMELESSVSYKIKIGGSNLGVVKTTMSGKLVFSAELTEKPIEVIITKE